VSTQDPNWYPTTTQFPAPQPVGYPQPGSYPEQQPYGGRAVYAAPQGGPIDRIGKTRNPWGVWLLSLVTLGIYGVWWYYTVNREIRDFDHRIDVQPGTALCAILFGWLVIFLIPLISWARTGSRIARAQRFTSSRDHCSSVIGVLLGIIGFGMVYYQSQLNKVWDQYGNPEAGTLRQH
jgi:Domain of unknown function (DUF4234)